MEDEGGRNCHSQRGQIFNRSDLCVLNFNFRATFHNFRITYDYAVTLIKRNVNFTRKTVMSK